jgi:hypothetical protein
VAWTYPMPKFTSPALIWAKRSLVYERANARSGPISFLSAARRASI